MREWAGEEAEGEVGSQGCISAPPPAHSRSHNLAPPSPPPTLYYTRLYRLSDFIAENCMVFVSVLKLRPELNGFHRNMLNQDPKRVVSTGVDLSSLYRSPSLLLHQLPTRSTDSFRGWGGVGD